MRLHVGSIALGAPKATVNMDMWKSTSVYPGAWLFSIDWCYYRSKLTRRWRVQ